MAIQLDQLSIGAKAVISRIDCTRLSESAVRRLRAIGIDVGVTVEPLHQGVLFARDPIAVRVGRMTIAIRAAQAMAIEVEPA